ncbi:MAG: tRNA pseudouridine(55) synthase TruB [Clostridia bacterium]|nr:tRNA pseudouridine(55) synthase TruB [Clostridia bacterium]
MKDGILIIDKPQDYTSHDVVAKCRKILQTKKIGHTGTLDPLATGVLVLCVGAATKLVDYLTCDDKIYDATMKLGIKTDTGDITGNVIESREWNAPETIEDGFWRTFIGKQTQIPPMYSAIKKDGVKLYELARQGIEVERAAREIEIWDISHVSVSGDTIKYRVHCSKGTYVRVLCEDIAEKLETVGTMTELRRIQSGKFSIEEACTLDEVSEDKIIPMEKLLNHSITIKENIAKLLNGNTLKYDLEDGLYNLYDNGQYIGIGEVKDKLLKRKIIVENDIHLV